MNSAMRNNTATPLGRAGALLLAVVLCVGLLPRVAWAGDASDASDAGAADESAQQTLTLTVTAGSQTDWTTNETTYPTWVNKQYTVAYVESVAQAQGGTGHNRLDDPATEAVEDGSLTMEDLLDAAVAAGDLKGYDASDSQYGKFLNGITSKDGATLTGWTTDDGSTSLYWSLYADGAYAQQSFDTTAVASGKAYQFAWAGSTTATAPSDWAQFYASNPADAATGTGDTVALTLTAGSKTDWTTNETTYPTWVNKQYALADVEAAAQAQGGTGHAADELTMQDLLDAAVAAGDLKGYASSPSSYGGLSLDGITARDGASLATWNSEDNSVSLYWATYDNGTYASTSFDQVKLAAGKAYQLAWTGFTMAAAPADWAQFYQSNPPAKPSDEPDTPSDPGVVNPPKGDEFPATGVDAAQAGTLMANIAASYAGTVEPWKVMDLAATGRLTADEAAAFVPQAVSDMTNPDVESKATVFQRSIIGLSAAQADATALPNGAETYNAVGQMSGKVTAASPINVLVFTLLAYESGSYEVPGDAALPKEALVNAILDKQLSDGGFSYSGEAGDADMTAMTISALATQAPQNTEAKNAMNRALTALKGMQNDDGGFGATGKGVAAGTNANSTAMAVIALAACDIDPATEWATEDGSTPLSALLSQATADLTGFTYGGKANDAATEQGFRALAAYQGLMNTKAAYNIYTQAKDGEATFNAEPTKTVDVPKGGTEQVQTSQGTPTATPTAKGGALAKTSDATAPAIATAAALTLGALATAALAARRARAREQARMR